LYCIARNWPEESRYSLPFVGGVQEKVKGKVHPRTGHESPKGEERCSSTLSLTSALDGVGGQHNTPPALPAGRRPGTHCIRGWVGPRDVLDGCGALAPTGIPSPDCTVLNKLVFKVKKAV